MYICVPLLLTYLVVHSYMKGNFCSQMYIQHSYPIQVLQKNYNLLDTSWNILCQSIKYENIFIMTLGLGCDDSYVIIIVYSLMSLGCDDSYVMNYSV